GNELVLRDGATGRDLGVLKGDGQKTSCLAIAPDGKVMASASTDGAIRLWDLANRTERSVIRLPKMTCRALVFSPDAKLLVAATYADTLRTWKVSTGKELASLPAHVIEC